MAVWEKIALGDLAKISYGYTAKASFEINGPKFLRITDIQDGAVNWSKVPSCEIDEAGYLKHKLKVDDIVFVRTGATTGKSFLITKCENSVAASYLIRVRLINSRIEPDFLYLFFQSAGYWDVVNAGTSGSAQGGFNASKLAGLTLPIPPIPEQKRIVAILDQAFADIEQARAKTEQNLLNARELFESYLQQVFSQRGEGWEELTLSQATGGVCTGPFGSLLHKSDYIENGIPLVNPAHITMRGIEPDSRKTVSKKNAGRLSNYIMRQGDIVIGRRGEMGRCALITEKEDGFLCGTGSFSIKASDRFHGGYLVRYLRSSSCKSRLEKIAGGAVMPNLSNTDLSNLILSLPSTDKQKIIVEMIDLLAVEIEAIISIYQKKLTALDELKKSILHLAFTGQLTSNKTKGAVA